jgi:hypothetical protein
MHPSLPPPLLPSFIDAGISVQKVAKVLGGEIVEIRANLLVWQNKGNPALHHPQSWLPSEKDAIGDRGNGGHLQIVTRPRAYIEAIKAPGRAAEVAQALREKMIRGLRTDLVP